MSRFSEPSNPGGGGDLPQPIATTSSPTFSKITLTSNGATDNITIGDDALVGDGNIANHIVIVGQQDSLEGGIVLGERLGEKISSDGENLTIEAAQGITINAAGGNMNFYMDGGMFIGATDSGNQIVKMEDLDPLQPPVDTSFAVAGGTIGGTQPTFNGAPLFEGSYVKHGDSVTFRINVTMTNITNFGTGQYYVDLPFPSKYGILMRNGCLHDASNSNQWAISGHAQAGQSTLTLWFTSGTGQDEIFDHNSPIGLAVEDTFHVSGTYIAA